MNLVFCMLIVATVSLTGAAAAPQPESSEVRHTSEQNLIDRAASGNRDTSSGWIRRASMWTDANWGARMEADTLNALYPQPIPPKEQLRMDDRLPELPRLTRG